MARPKSEKTKETRVRSVRLPTKVWDDLQVACRKEYRTPNQMIQMLIENWLVENKYMKDEHRKR